MKQFGVRMDSHHAAIVGYADVSASEFFVLGHADNSGVDGNSNENAKHNRKKTLQNHFFKEITSHMQHADEVHLTGNGIIQDQFIRYLAGAPQFKNTVETECTSNKMSGKRLVEFISGKCN